MPSLAKSLADRHYAEGDFTRKAPSYLQEYERILEGLRDKEARILELGVSSGASLLLWRDYLPNATIVGIDIEEIPEKHQQPGKRSISFRASQDEHGGSWKRQPK